MGCVGKDQVGTSLDLRFGSGQRPPVNVGRELVEYKKRLTNTLVVLFPR